jgi:hypothetical protein
MDESSKGSTSLKITAPLDTHPDVPVKTGDTDRNRRFGHYDEWIFLKVAASICTRITPADLEVHS